MTLVMLQAAPDGIDIVTDTLSYDSAGRSFGRTSKCELHPHLDAAVAGFGMCALSAEFNYRINLCDPDHPLDGVRNLDQLSAVALATLPHLWEKTGEGGTAVFLAGWSPRHDRHVVYVHNSGRQFLPDVVDEAFYVRPQPEEPPTAAPETIEEMVALALAVREEQHPDRDWFVPIGGELIHTHIERGLAYQRRVYVFDDRTTEWAARP